MDKSSTTFQLLVELKLFSDEEIRGIVKRRTDFEYVLRRNELKPQNYYTYLQFELNLDNLLEIRLEKFSQNKSNRNTDSLHKSRLIKGSFLRHICYIFERATRRFCYEICLWDDYLEFLTHKKANSMLSTLFGKVLSLHPKEEKFWLQAAVSYFL